MKSYYVHYKNKYPGCQIQMSEGSLDVYSNGQHLVSLVKNGAGQIVDRSEEMGCSEKHDLAPIPKSSRCFKLYADGKIGPSEEHSERSQWVKKFAKKHERGYDYVPAGKDEDFKEEIKPAPVEAPKVEAPAEEPQL